jgi:dolichol-phosphate mannosyltransferase
MPLFLSIVVPAYNEAANLDALVEQLSTRALALSDRLEIVIVNDGSRDDTAGKIIELEASYPFVRGIHFSRNFGKEAALEAGLEQAQGDAVLFVDADLQHPPTLIPSMIAEWRAGADVVNARKRDRGTESMLYGAASRLFYRVFSKAAGGDFRGASDYKLIDRQVADAVKQCQERNRFFRGLVAWVGFRQVDLPFDVQPRAMGEASWSTWQLMRYSISNLLSFSSLPLVAVAIAGLSMTAISFLLLMQTLIRYLMGNAQDGFTTVIVSQAAFSGVILLAVGVLAMYVARLYDEQKRRPVYIVRAATRRDKPLSDARRPQLEEAVEEAMLS